MQIGSTNLVLVDVEAKSAMSSIAEQCDVVAPEMRNLAATIKKLKDAVPSDQAPTCKLHILLDTIENKLAGVADEVTAAADNISDFLGGVLVDDQRVAYIVRPAA